ncbi:MAG: CoB--CoM heterodisulfide reductase iron-sulfur subunit B family protein [Thermodesulfobacteriota bacterium]
MKYLYYPGCSLQSTAREYDAATRAAMAALDVELTEIEGWTCCGASAAEGYDERLALALPAINLAIAETMTASDDILVPCSACYLNLKKSQQAAVTDAAARETINEILSVESLQYTGRARPRHLLDILSKDIGAGAVANRVTHSLSGLRIAPYYGCQCLRPYRVFDDPETPTSMDALIRATGAAVHPWSMGNRCCGASHMTTRTEVGQQLVYRILKAARGADAIATVCPMCQINLEGYQRRISAKYHDAVRISVIYLPQLLGAAMGVAPEKLDIADNLALFPELRQQLEFM